MRFGFQTVSLVVGCLALTSACEAGPRAAYRQAYQNARLGQQAQWNAAANGQFLQFLMTNGPSLARDVLSLTDRSQSGPMVAQDTGPSENASTLEEIRSDLKAIKKSLGIVAEPMRDERDGGSGAAGGAEFRAPTGTFPGFPR